MASPKEVSERMATLHKLRNNVVKAVSAVEHDLPKDSKFDGVRSALAALSEVQKAL